MSHEFQINGKTSPVNLLPRGLSSVDQDFWFSSKEIGTDICMGYKVDVYGGIILDPTSLPNDIDAFRAIFEHTLTHLKQIGFHKGFWLRIPVDKIEFLPVCVKEFEFVLHHARCDYVMLVKWMHPTQPNPIPRQSSHQAGIASIVLREDGCVLFVKEKVGPAAAGCGIWKLPTGLVEPVEDLYEAAVREVSEEVGLNCEFDSIISIRHSHGGSPELGASSDILFVCLLRPDDGHEKLVLQESEIAQALWVHYKDIDELTQCEPGTSAGKLMETVRDLAAGKIHLRIRGVKLPAWRRKNCDQWIFRPVDLRDEQDSQVEAHFDPSPQVYTQNGVKIDQISEYD